MESNTAWSSAPLLSQRQDMVGQFASSDFPPFDIEASTISEERSPDSVVHGHLDLESLGRVVVPFPHVCCPAEQHRKAEADHAFVESLRARAQPKTAVFVDGQVDVDGEVLV